MVALTDVWLYELIIKQLIKHLFHTFFVVISL